MPPDCDDLEDLPNTINVLLMGETGVGKSTFINSFANYIRFSTFADATKTKPLMLIPTRITVYDENSMEDCSLTIGSDKNEKQDVGSSATQGVKTYLFPVESDNVVIRVIDTPGIGDTAGPDKDDQNCEGILGYLAQLNKINAICLLMKPSNDRNTVLFSYCVRRILSQLHKSACDNVVFLFTNTKGSDYRPGATFAILKKLADDVAAKPPHVRIPIKKENVFCLDNESFKHLLALEYGVELNERTLESCKISWKISCEEIVRFIKYIRKLDPHNVKQTVSVNKTRDLILQLSKPLSDICQLLQEKIINLKTKEEESSKANQTIEELKKSLYKPGLDLEIIKMDRSATVCTNLSCIQPVQMVDEDVLSNIQSEEKQRERIEALIGEIKQEKKELEKELEYVSECAAKFAYFLENNAITSSYDNFKEYIFLSLQRQKSLGNQANMDVVVNLTELLRRHENLIKAISENQARVNAEKITEESIYRDAESLFKLKHMGPKIKEIFEARASCAKKGFKTGLKSIFTEKIPNWFMN
ncbi:uncharacterized protein LOC135137026 isoform X2 [Zophobas morio]|uniref:uncharacterized protein LOC135137026 isoform X2 n=1 Tax=Zophobas morio TaxID=2755281 RepID=UPI0030828E58